MTQGDIDYNDIAVRGNRRMTRDDLQLLERTAGEINAKVIVEVGSMDGCSSMLFGRLAARFGGHLWCIEPRPTSRWLQNMTDWNLTETVTLIKAACPWLDWSDIPQRIDYLFIDGDHRTSRAIADYVALGRFVRAGGRIAFHDINGGKDIGTWVQEAVDICLRDDNLSSPQGRDYKVRQIARTPAARNRGTVVFEKLSDAEPLKKSAD